MTATTNAPNPQNATQSKEWLKQQHPNWSIVHSDQDRWWGFLNTDKRGKDTVPHRTTAADADTPEELHELLIKAES